MQYSGPTTTETSKTEGRLKVDAGKKKLLKQMVKSCDGAGGPGMAGYGKSPTTSSYKPKGNKSSPKFSGAFKLKKISALSSMVKASKFKSFKKASTSKAKSFSSLMSKLH